MTVLCVSIQPGAVDRRFVSEIGHSLGLRVIDQRAFERTLGEQPANAGGVAHGIGGSRSFGTADAWPMSYSQLAARLREHWLEAASVRNVLIVGWGVAAGLHSLRGAHKILVRASIAVRERNIKRQLRFAHLGTASLELESQDAAARIYMQRLFGADWLDPDLYDVAIDMDAMSPGKARAVIGALTCNPLHVGPSPSRCEIDRALEAVASNTEDQPLTWLGARSTDWLRKRPPEVPRFPRMDLRDRERDDPQPDDPVPGDMGWWEDFLPPEQAG